MSTSDKPLAVALPGGQHARLAKPEDVTERKRRPIKIAAIMLGPRRMQEIYASLPTTADADQDQVAADLHLSRTEAEIIFELNDLGVLAVLESWTLSRPIPTTVEELQDLPSAVYEALAKGAARAAGPLVAEALGAGTPADEGFDLGSVGDESSPTGASGDFDPQSTPEAGSI